MKYLEEIEYPCGLRQKITLQKGFFEFMSISNIESERYLRENGCPIHGKNCSKLVNYNPLPLKRKMNKESLK